MFCRFCGKNINDDSIFCDGCGRNLKEKVTKTVYAPASARDNGYMESPRVEKKIQDFQQPAMANPTPAQKTEAPDTPLTNKKSIVPYILLPIAVIIAALVNTAMPLLTGFINNKLINKDFLGTDNFLADIAFSHFSSFASAILPTLIVLVLFSLCCKGLNQKFRFISSFYAASVSSIIPTIVCVIVGYIILYAVGFHDRESSNIYSGVAAVCELLTMFILIPLLASLWFAFSEKYTVNKEEKSQPVKMILPCIFIVIYVLIDVILTFIVNLMWVELKELFGEYSNVFASDVLILITNSVSLILLFLFGLACKGGYRKLAFVGSIYFAQAIFVPVSSLFMLIFSIISDGKSSMYTLGNYIGIGVQGVLTITLSIVLYILMNRYVIEKTEKKKA